jgi:hypothetical protein
MPYGTRQDRRVRPRAELVLWMQAWRVCPARNPVLPAKKGTIPCRARRRRRSVALNGLERCSVALGFKPLTAQCGPCTAAGVPLHPARRHPCNAR